MAGGFGLGFGLAQVAGGLSQGLVQGKRYADDQAAREKELALRERQVKVSEDEHAIHQRDADQNWNLAQSKIRAAAANWLGTPDAPQAAQPAPEDAAMLDAAGGGGAPPSGFTPPPAQGAPAASPSVPAGIPAGPPSGSHHAGQGAGATSTGIIQANVQTGRGTPANPPGAFLAAANAKKAEYHRLRGIFDRQVQAASSDYDKAALNDYYEKNIKPVESEAVNLKAQADQAQYLQDMKTGFNLFITGDKEGAKKYLGPIVPADALAQMDKAVPAKVYGMDGYQIKGADGKVVFQAPTAILATMWDPTVPPNEGLKLYHDFMLAQQKFGHDEKMMQKQLAAMLKPTEWERDQQRLEKLNQDRRKMEGEGKKAWYDTKAGAWKGDRDAIDLEAKVSDIRSKWNLGRNDGGGDAGMLKEQLTAAKAIVSNPASDPEAVKEASQFLQSVVSGFQQPQGGGGKGGPASAPVPAPQQPANGLTPGQPQAGGKPVGTTVQLPDGKGGFASYKKTPQGWVQTK